MTKHPLITIGIPTYNRSMWLEQSIASCLQQTYPNIEVVVSDNASTDDTSVMIKRLNDPRIQYIRHNKPLPPYVNWNSCWKNVNSQYMTYLSDDDLLEPTFLSTLMEEVHRHPDAALYRTGLRCIDAKGNVKWEHLNYPYLETPEQFMFERIRNRRHQFLPGFLFKTDEIRAVNGFLDNGLPAMLFLDDFLWFRLAFRGASVVSVNKALWNYRQHDMQYGGKPLDIAAFAKHVPHYISLLSILARHSGCSNNTLSFLESHYGREMIESRIVHEKARENVRSVGEPVPKKRWKEMWTRIPMYLMQKKSHQKTLTQSLSKPDYKLPKYLTKEENKTISVDVDKIRKFKNLHKGQRCFIVGNGPSLNQTDLTKLQNEISFGVNGIFLKTDEVGYVPNYYSVCDSFVIEENAERINSYDVKQHKFFPSFFRKFINVKSRKNVSFFMLNRGFNEVTSPNYAIPRFSADCSERIYDGQTVTYVNLQLAYYMGFTEVYLIGVDFSYVIPDSAIVNGCNITSTEDDPNHFDKNYFGKGRSWHDPVLHRVIRNYQFADLVFKWDDRQVFNATKGGKLEAFKRVDYDSLFVQSCGRGTKGENS